MSVSRVSEDSLPVLNYWFVDYTEHKCSFILLFKQMNLCRLQNDFTLFCVISRWLSCPAAEMVDGSRVLYFEQVEYVNIVLDVFNFARFLYLQDFQQITL